MMLWGLATLSNSLIYFMLTQQGRVQYCGAHFEWCRNAFKCRKIYKINTLFYNWALQSTSLLQYSFESSTNILVPSGLLYGRDIYYKKKLFIGDSRDCRLQCEGRQKSLLTKNHQEDEQLSLNCRFARFGMPATFFVKSQLLNGCIFIFIFHVNGNLKSPYSTVFEEPYVQLCYFTGIPSEVLYGDFQAHSRKACENVGI